MSDILRKLAAKPEYRSQTARELWPNLFATLDDLTLGPQEIYTAKDGKGSTYEYDFNGKRKKISFRQFANILSKIPRGKESV